MHERMHKGEKKLEKHITKFHSGDGEKMYKCNACPKSFSSSGSLKRHEIVNHSYEKPFQCRHCSKSFSTYNVS